MPDDKAVENVLQYNQNQLVDIIHAQMEKHFQEPGETEYDVVVSKGFITLRAGSCTTSADSPTCPFREPVEEKSLIKGLFFGGFSKCLYSRQKFDSDTERRFAMLLEDDPTVRKWLKPLRGQLQIYNDKADAYKPDFVVETEAAKFLCEPKRANEMTDATVITRAKAAATWCQHATQHAQAHGGKPWEYLLIPHDRITNTMTLSGLASSCRYEV